jgi:hypothetical protein
LGAAPFCFVEARLADEACGGDSREPVIRVLVAGSVNHVHHAAHMGNGFSTIPENGLS